MTDSIVCVSVEVNLCVNTTILATVLCSVLHSAHQTHICSESTKSTQMRCSDVHWCYLNQSSGVMFIVQNNSSAFRALLWISLMFGKVYWAKNKKDNMNWRRPVKFEWCCRVLCFHLKLTVSFFTVLQGFTDFSYCNMAENVTLSSFIYYISPVMPADFHIF